MEITKKMNANTLKMIAVITMFIDHLGATLVWAYLLTLEGDAKQDWNTIYMVMRWIGRLAFPIYCFFIVQGLEHTRNVKKYIARLLIFALVSEIPFDYAIAGGWTLEYQNVFFTLAIGLICIWGIKEVEEHMSENKKQILIKTCIIVLGTCVAYLMNTDYSGFGVFAIALLYLFKEKRGIQCTVGAISFMWEITAPLSFLLLYFYNGEKGRKINKYLFYGFYPIHLLLLAMLKIIFFGN